MGVIRRGTDLFRNEVTRDNKYVAWRKVPEFPQYEMNRKGELRHESTFTLRKPSYNGTHYHVLIREGKKYSRTVKRLHMATFPELFKDG